MDLIDFGLGIGTSLVATIIGTVYKKCTSLILPKYPDLRGSWIAEYEVNGIILYDHIFIKRQFWKTVTGKLISSDSTNIQRKFEYSFEAKFINDNLLHGVFRPVKNNILDYGTFLLTLNTTVQEATGGSISYNYGSQIVTARNSVIKRI